MYRKLTSGKSRFDSFSLKRFKPTSHNTVYLYIYILNLSCCFLILYQKGIPNKMISAFTFWRSSFLHAKMAEKQPLLILKSESSFLIT